MMKTPRPLDGVIRAIEHARSVILVCHISPDGDTVGGALALRLALLAMDKQVQVCCENTIPELLTFLPGAEAFLAPEEAVAEADLLLSVDVSDERRMGRCRELIARVHHTAQIDHHATNTICFEENCVDGSVPANCLIIYELLQRMNCPITPDIATCLATGLSTDTGHLAYGSTTPEAFRMMGEMWEKGAKVAQIWRMLYGRRPFRQVKLLEKALSTLQMHHQGQITSLQLTLADFAECGALQEDAESIVNYGLEISGVRMAVFARETESGQVKLSLRAVEPDCVSGVASALGGGGHAQASGAMVNMPLEQAVAETVRLMKAEMEKA